jgi:hypothetical protein
LKALFFKLLSDLDTQAALYIGDILDQKTTLAELFARLTDKAKQEIEAVVEQTLATLTAQVNLFSLIYLMHIYI